MRTVLLFTLLALTPRLFAQYQWNYIGDITDAYGFYNADTYAYLESFQLQFTTDGGATSTTSNFFPGLLTPVVACHYEDENTILMVQRDLTSLFFWSSTDGGLNFTEMGQITLLDGYTYNAIRGMHFFDADTGFLFVRTLFEDEVTDVLIKTTDGGATWTFAAPAEQTTSAKDIVFEAPSTVRIFASSEVLVSTDLAETWTSAGTHPLSVTGVFAMAGDLVWGVGDGGSDQPCNTISTDGGATFSAWNIPDFASGGFDECGERMAAASATSMVVSGHEDGQSNEIALFSQDGGTTFAPIAWPDTEDHSGENIFLGDDGLTYFYRSFTDTYVFEPGVSNSVDETALSHRVTLYPNPATAGVVHLSEPQSEVTVFTSLGEQVFSCAGWTSALDLSHLTPGVYLVQLEGRTERLILR